MATIANVHNVSNISSGVAQSSEQSNVKSKEYYVRVPKTRKRFHAMKFHAQNVDLQSWAKADMTRDISNLPATQRSDWENLPKSGVGSEFNREAKELSRRKKFGYMAKKTSVEDLPWILASKGSEKEKGKERQYIGKKSITENSSYFVFIKCADGGFEAHPLEDWYAFAPHKTYKTLNFEEAEEEFKRRHKILNKHLIMYKKRQTEGEEGEEEEEGEKSTKPSTSKAGKSSWDSDEDDKKGKKSYKSSNLSEESEDGGDSDEEKPKSKTKKPKRREIGSDDEVKHKEDSDDGDHEGIEKDYSSTDSSLESEPETTKYEEKYKEKGIDEEEAIKALDKSGDEESDEEGLTEEGKEYRKLINKEGKSDEEEDKDSDEFDEIFKNGKSTKEKDESSSSIDEFDLEESDKSKKPKSQVSGASALDTSKTLKRKAADNLAKTTSAKKNKPQTSGGVASHDESSSSSSTSTANLTTKSAKTASIIAAAAAAKQASSEPQLTSSASFASLSTSGSILTEDEVRRYLIRKPMTTKELLHKFRSKTQNTMSNEQLLEKLKAILDKLNAKMIDKNGTKYLTI